VSPPASSQDGLLHDLERKPKKTQTAKKNQLYIKGSKNTQFHAGGWRPVSGWPRHLKINEMKKESPPVVGDDYPMSQVEQETSSGGRRIARHCGRVEGTS
jgi:hypothetical protein